MRESKVEKASEFGVTDHSSTLYLSDSAVSMQGWRRAMDDPLIVHLPLSQGEGFFGVFVGHGGQEVAEFGSQEVAVAGVDLTQPDGVSLGDLICNERKILNLA